jgi:hypothetical protein
MTSSKTSLDVAGQLVRIKQMRADIALKRADAALKKQGLSFAP